VFSSSVDQTLALIEGQVQVIEARRLNVKACDHEAIQGRRFANTHSGSVPLRRLCKEVQTYKYLSLKTVI
jgi:hypothetical protein